MGIFPDDAAIMRLVGALIVEQNEKWRNHRNPETGSYTTWWVWGVVCEMEANRAGYWFPSASFFDGFVDLLCVGRGLIVRTGNPASPVACITFERNSPNARS